MLKFAKRRGPKPERTALDLIEEAFHLLRTAPLGILGTYLIGTLPFVLGILFFWADMASHAFAHRRVLEASLGIALLFLWMKAWQTVFVNQLRARLSRLPLQDWSAGAVFRMVVMQTIVQPTGLVIIPIAGLMLIPFAWVCAFYQSFTVVGNGESADFKSVFQRAVRQTSLWPGQNHLLLLILALFGCFVFFNILVTAAMIPGLLKSILGIETVFSQGSLINTTFFVVVCAVTYLCIDPLNKAVYALRCFYGEARHSGADLRAELQCVSPQGVVIALILFCLISFLSLPPPAMAEQAPAAVDSRELDESIERTIQKQEYSWRLPREEVEENKEKGIIEIFIDDMLETLKGWVKTVWGWYESFMDWIKKLFPEKDPDPKPRAPGSPWDWQLASQLMISALLCVAVSVVAILLLRMWRTRRLRRLHVTSQAVLPIPDLTDENIAPSDLPFDRWTELANELLTRGELRLALRAFYMACLAHLAGRELVTIARFKSNREYQRELMRKARAQPELLDAFGQNMMLFERTWYGRDEATRQTIAEFAANQNRITSTP